MGSPDHCGALTFRGAYKFNENNNIPSTTIETHYKPFYPQNILKQYVSTGVHTERARVSWRYDLLPELHNKILKNNNLNKKESPRKGYLTRVDERIAEIHPWLLLWWLLSKFATELISVSKCPHLVGIKLKPHVYFCSSFMSVSNFSNCMYCSAVEKWYGWTSQNICALRKNRS